MAKKKDEWITVAQAAVILGCSKQTIYNRVRWSGTALGDCKRVDRRWMLRRAWVDGLGVGHKHSTQKAQIEGLKTRLAAAEKERDQANARRSSHAKARDKWAADHARQTNQIGALEARLVREARAYKQLRTDNEALKLEIQTYADTYAEAHPPAVIDRLVAAVESAPLGALMQIDKSRHAALRRVVHLWTAVQHAVEHFTPGDSAQTNNNDDEVT